MNVEITLGWDGKCAEHRTSPSLARRRLDLAPVVGAHNECGRAVLLPLIEVHCARGHKYLAAETDEYVHDPFSEDEEAEIWGDEGFPLPPDREEF